MHPRSKPVLKATNKCARKEGEKAKSEFNRLRKEGIQCKIKIMIMKKMGEGSLWQLFKI